jgi:all-trans-retinol dehydrogenase (NAD+)
MDLADKCAIITGGAMGIGLATCKRLLAESTMVTIWDIDKAALKKAEKDLAGYGTVYLHQCDVTNNRQVQKHVKIARKEMGSIDILINNAGYVSGGDFLERPIEDWEKTVDVNLKALLYTTYAVLPGMYKRDCGFIVNISSAAGTIGVPDLSVYSATKWGVWGLTESLRFEAHNRRKRGVKFASIHPSYIAKGMFEGAKLGIPGRWFVPSVKNHDVIAKAIVEGALKKEKYSPKRPCTVNLNLRFRAFMPDRWFQRFLIIMGVTKSMKTWRGRRKK